jgi:2-polyprenyl-3-methyl-5-hydroxy-6-metoxy-1,4-benzoquinol methylase
MKMDRSATGGLGASRYGYLHGQLTGKHAGQHLDYGCFDGWMLQQLADRQRIAVGIGCDLNSDAPRRSSSSSIKLHYIAGPSAVANLVSIHGPFDSASLLDVLEHVHDQQALLRSLHSALKPDGRLVVTVPQQHVFSWMDGGNVKFRFPRLHKRLYRLRHTEEEYRYRYVDNPNGLIGDVEAKKGWHQHFRSEELRSLLVEAGFHVEDVDGAGLFHRPLVYLKRLGIPVGRLIELDAQRWSKCHLFMTAHRVG